MSKPTERDKEEEHSYHRKQLDFANREPGWHCLSITALLGILVIKLDKDMHGMIWWVTLSEEGFQNTH